MKLSSSVQKVAVTLLLASGVILFLQWNASTKLHRENKKLRAIANEVQRLREDNAGLTQIQSALEHDRYKWSADNNELLKLRNEVARVREQGKELERLRAEIQQLRAERAARIASAKGDSNSESYAKKQFEMIEVDDSMALSFALLVPLIEEGKYEKATQLLAKPIGTYYRVYKSRTLTEQGRMEERLDLLRRIDEAAKTYPVIARELERKIE